MANENKVLSFIDEVNKEKQTIAGRNAFMNSPTYKKQQLDANMGKAKTDCLQYIFADLYKNSLPLDDSYINCNDEKLTNDMKDFINRQTANRGIDCYVREAIKRGNKSLEHVVESVNRLVGDCFREKVINVQRLNAADLDWKFDDEKRACCDQISKDANLDEVSRYIKDNVKAAAEYEKERIKKKKEETAELQKELEENDELTSESSIEHYLLMSGRKDLSAKSVYQPTLFEGVMMSKFNHLPSETREEQLECYNEAVGEFTLLNMTKALRVAEYSLQDMQRIAKDYSRM